MKSVFFFLCFISLAYLECTPIKACVAPTGSNTIPTCGFQYDNCGGKLPCFDLNGVNANNYGCASNQYCSNTGTCVTASSNACTPKKATDFLSAGLNCGPVGDGCGGIIQLGACDTGSECKQGVCIKTTCVSQYASDVEFCAALALKGITCGTHLNDCGVKVNCACKDSSYVCNNNNECRPPVNTGCVPKPDSSYCVIQGLSSTIKLCGFVNDDCQSTVDCSKLNYQGPCPNNQICVKNLCVTPVSQCQPATVCPKILNPVKNVAETQACGVASDGCTGTLTCGTCGTDQVCRDGFCYTKPTCVPRTTCVATSNILPSCGVQSDGCGGFIKCSTDVCPSGSQCDFVGTGKCQPKICTATTVKCKPLSTNVVPECGFQTDECGSPIMCGTCSTGSICKDGKCIPICQKRDVCKPVAFNVPAECGVEDDGCGGSLNCGTCKPGYICVDKQCKASTTQCTPRTCQVANTGALASCGNSSDGCGGSITCGTCPTGFDCVSQRCFPKTCVPSTKCSSYDVNSNLFVAVECGTQPDGCGGSLTCGTCANGQACKAGKCVDVGTCIPAKVCADSKENSVLGITAPECGVFSDNCGGQIVCGKCPPGSVCEKYKCVAQCTPTTTVCPANTCGFISNGCGDAIPCSPCKNGFCYKGKCVDCIDLTFTFTDRKPTDEEIKNIIKKVLPDVNNIDITVTRNGNSVSIKICPPTTKSSTTVKSGVSSSLNEAGFTTDETKTSSASSLFVSVALLFLVSLLF